MNVPPNWPTDRHVYAQEGWALAGEALGLQRTGEPIEGVQLMVADAAGTRLTGVLSCCVATGEVRYHPMRDGIFMTDKDGNLEVRTSFYAAPLQITYKRHP